MNINIFSLQNSKFITMQGRTISRAGGTKFALPDFDRSVNPILTRGRFTLGLFKLRSFKSQADEVMNLSNC